VKTSKVLQSRMVLACLVAMIAPGFARAQVARIELHVFETQTLSDQEFLTGRKEGKSVLIAGELRIPTRGTERLPAVTLVHGSGGVSGYVDDWAQFLNSLGIVTFVFDSFTPRGIINTNNNQEQLGRLAMIVDAYRALKLLAEHPRVDPQRIALMGFSRGGQAALYSSLKRFQRMHGPRDATYAAYIAFYPSCNTTFLQDDVIAEKPVRIYHGTADNYVPVAPCRAYVERLRKAGADVRLTEFPGAQHVFDWAMLKTPAAMPEAQTTRRCRIEESTEGRLVNSETKQPFTLKDPCVERGTTLAYDADAAARARAAVREFVGAVLLNK
jgi:dienelactone hydrolase